VSLLPAAPLTDDTDYRMIHEELSGEIIGAAMTVLNELKPGLDEKLYERAMIIELKHRGHILVFVMSSGVEASLESSR
jgi:PD-(D/E)XK nuclease superfamily